MTTKLIVIFFLASAIAVLSSAVVPLHSMKTRQPPAVPSNCAPLLPTQECVQAIEGSISAFFRAIPMNGGPIPVPLNRESVSNALDTLCGPNCYDKYVAFQRCVNQSAEEAYFVNGVCGRNADNVYCYLALIDFIGNNNAAIIPTYACGSPPPTAGCTSNCADTLNRTRIQLGCCAAGLYNTSTLLSPVSDQYARCNIPLGSLCSGVAGLVYLSVTLLVTITAASTILNVMN